MPVGLPATPFKDDNRWMQAASVALIMAALGMMSLESGSESARRIMAVADRDRSVSAVLRLYGIDNKDLAAARELVNWRAAMAAATVEKRIVTKRACQRL